MHPLVTKLVGVFYFWPCWCSYWLPVRCPSTCAKCNFVVHGAFPKNMRLLTDARRMKTRFWKAKAFTQRFEFLDNFLLLHLVFVAMQKLYKSWRGTVGHEAFKLLRSWMWSTLASSQPSCRVNADKYGSSSIVRACWVLDLGRIKFSAWRGTCVFQVPSYPTVSNSCHDLFKATHVAIGHRHAIAWNRRGLAFAHQIYVYLH